MKKLSKLTLSKKKLGEVKAGYDNNFPQGIVLKSRSTSDSSYGCGCGCAGCIWEDGGAGFSVGMMYNNLG